MDIIHVLPDSVANQIAAGEVVQRPSSIVKELVENSIDAGATRIHVSVSDGGRQCVQVIDNGKGMSETDARLSFERHATSKISQATDLFALATMGFRGEALASIASVSQVEMKTRRPDDELGTYIRLSGSHVEQQEPTSCPVGTNLAVKNIFFNIPARRKFLKSSQAEMGHVINEFERTALANPQLEFLLCNNDVELYNLPAANRAQRICDMFGKKVSSELLPVEVETELVTISGYVGKPESSRKKGSHQFFFVNGRYMRSMYFTSAVMKYYENLIPTGEHVSFFLYLTVDPATIDVNVHPTKTEIKFDNESEIWHILSAAVFESLGKYNDVPSIDFDQVDRPEIPALSLFDKSGERVSTPKSATAGYDPFKVDTSYNNAIQQQLWSDTVASRREIMLRPDEELPTDSDAMTCEVDSAFQYSGRFLVAPSDNGLVVVDQHRAHLKVLYEGYMNNLRGHRGVSQRLLFPELIQFSRVEETCLENILSDVEAIGFELTNLGGGSYSITGTPSGLEGLNPINLLHDLVYSSMETVVGIKESVQAKIANTMAKSAAIISGQILSDDEIRNLLTQLFRLPMPKYTPDGQPVFFILETTFLEQQLRK